MLVTVNSRVLAAVYQSQRRVGRLLWSGDVRLDVLFGQAAASRVSCLGRKMGSSAKPKSQKTKKRFLRNLLFS